MSVIAYNITGMVKLWYASASIGQRSTKNKFTLLTHVCFALSSGFLMAPRRKGLSSWSLCKSPCGGGLNLLCHFNSPPPAVEQARSNGWSSSQPPNTSLKKKELTAEKSWKTKHCRIRWTSYKILFSNPDAHISFDSHRAAKFVL